MLAGAGNTLPLANKEYTSAVAEIVRVIVANGTDSNATTAGSVRRGEKYPEDIIIVSKQIDWSTLRPLLAQNDKIRMVAYSTLEDDEEYRATITYTYNTHEYTCLIIVADDTTEQFPNLVWWYTGSPAEIRRLQDLAATQDYFSLNKEGLKSDSETVAAYGEDSIYTELGETTPDPSQR
jgi:DNA polymerase/3'-5' exonuclease PolX